MLSFFPRGVLDEILNLIESVSEGFPSYAWKLTVASSKFATSKSHLLPVKNVASWGFCSESNFLEVQADFS